MESEPIVLVNDTIYVTRYELHSGQTLDSNITNNYNTYVTDTLAPALKIVVNKIDEQQRNIATLQGQVKAGETKVTVAKENETYYKDKYFSAITRTDTVGNSTMDYRYDAKLDITTERKSRFLRDDVEIVHITSPDKNFRVNGVEHFKKESFVLPKNWGVGIQVGYYYIPATNTFLPAVRAGISYNLIKF